MEEKIIIKSGKTAVKKTIIFVMILTILICVGVYLCPFFAPYDYETFKYHTIYDEHDYECYDPAKRGLVPRDDPEWGLFMEDYGIQPTNCEWTDNDLFSFIYFLDLYYPTFFFIGAIILFICILSAFLTKSKFYITKTNIYGRNCFKKFNIAFDDIIETTKKGNSIIIKTANKKIKLQSLKKCDEIYNYIKSNITEKQILHTKEKKSWSAKKILLSFLLIGFIGGLILNTFLFVNEMNYFINEIVNHTHVDSCYAVYYDTEVVRCYESEIMTQYGNAFFYAFNLDEIIINFICVIGISEVLAGLILLVRGIKNSKNNQKIKEEKISNSVTNILD